MLSLAGHMGRESGKSTKNISKKTGSFVKKKNAKEINLEVVKKIIVQYFALIIFIQHQKMGWNPLLHHPHQ